MFGTKSTVTPHIKMVSPSTAPQYPHDTHHPAAVRWVQHNGEHHEDKHGGEDEDGQQSGSHMVRHCSAGNRGWEWWEVVKVFVATARSRLTNKPGELTTRSLVLSTRETLRREPHIT